MLPYGDAQATLKQLNRIETLIILLNILCNKSKGKLLFDESWDVKYLTLYYRLGKSHCCDFAYKIKQFLSLTIEFHFHDHTYWKNVNEPNSKYAVVFNINDHAMLFITLVSFHCMEYRSAECNSLKSIVRGTHKHTCLSLMTKLIDSTSI